MGDEEILEVSPVPPTEREAALMCFDAQEDARFQVRRITPGYALQELAQIQFDESYRMAASKKFAHWVVKAHQLSAPGANILKQTCLTLGAEAGVHRGAINCTVDRESVLITATQAQLEKLILKLRPQPFGLKSLSKALTRMLQRQKQLQNKPILAMAVLNVTPDSFSDGGQFRHLDDVVAAAASALDAGATILDVGGESTRPGASFVPAELECRRVLPALQAIKSAFPSANISIDTRKASVAQAALELGASMINDVSGGQFDVEMFRLVAAMQCPYVLMHSVGTPDTMQQNPSYQDVLEDVSAFFYRQVAHAVSAGVSPAQIILDPGFGFGKTVQHNNELLKRLSEIVSIGFPVLVGLSRKSFLAQGNADTINPSDREVLTASAMAIAAQAGASIFRIHNPALHMPVLQMLTALYGPLQEGLAGKACIP